MGLDDQGGQGGQCGQFFFANFNLINEINFLM